MNASVASFFVEEFTPLGRGGMGITHLGRLQGARGFERLVVIKRLHEHLQEEEQSVQRLIDEAQLAGYVRHPNVVSVLHADCDERGPYIVLEYVEGASLSHLTSLSAGGLLDRAIILRVMLDCLAGLEAIHSACDHQQRSLNILHRDISGDNILVGTDGSARLADFGIAKSVINQVQTAPSRLIGKAPYMAPEYIEGGAVGPAVDIYSLGIVMWTMLAGRSPWRGLDEAQLLVRALTEGVPPLPEDVGDAGLRQVVARACARTASERYASATEMKAALIAMEACYPIAQHSEVGAQVERLAQAGILQRRKITAERVSVNGLLVDQLRTTAAGALAAQSGTFPTRRANSEDNEETKTLSSEEIEQLVLSSRRQPVATLRAQELAAKTRQFAAKNQANHQPPRRVKLSIWLMAAVCLFIPGVLLSLQPPVEPATNSAVIPVLSVELEKESKIFVEAALSTQPATEHDVHLEPEMGHLSTAVQPTAVQHLANPGGKAKAVAAARPTKTSPLRARTESRPQPPASVPVVAPALAPTAARSLTPVPATEHMDSPIVLRNPYRGGR